MVALEISNFEAYLVVGHVFLDNHLDYAEIEMLRDRYFVGMPSRYKGFVGNDSEEAQGKKKCACETKQEGRID